MFENLSKIDAENIERELIQKYNCVQPNGYNISLGGDCRGKHSKASIEKMKASKKGKYCGINNPNYKNNKLAGENHFNYGKKFSEETKQKISKSRIEKEVAKGKKNPMYDKRFYCVDNPNYGKRWNDKSREKASVYWKNNSIFALDNPKKTKVINLDTNEVFDSIVEAKKIYKKGCISSCVRGLTNKAGGYRWAYCN